MEPHSRGELPEEEPRQRGGGAPGAAPLEEEVNAADWYLDIAQVIVDFCSEDAAHLGECYHFLRSLVSALRGLFSHHVELLLTALDVKYAREKVRPG